MKDVSDFLNLDVSNIRFVKEYEALKYWFDTKFEHVDDDNIELELAFMKNLKHNLSDVEGIKSIKDIDISITYSDNYLTSWERIYSKYYQDNSKNFSGGLLVL